MMSPGMRDRVAAGLELAVLISGACFAVWILTSCL